MQSIWRLSVPMSDLDKVKRTIIHLIGMNQGSTSKTRSESANQGEPSCHTITSILLRPQTEKSAPVAKNAGSVLRLAAPWLSENSTCAGIITSRLQAQVLLHPSVKQKTASGWPASEHPRSSRTFDSSSPLRRFYWQQAGLVSHTALVRIIAVLNFGHRQG